MAIHTDHPRIMVLACGPGSETLVEECGDVLSEFELPAEFVHLQPRELASVSPVIAAAAERDGIQVIIAIASGKLSLAARIAPHTKLPVLSVPVGEDPESALRSLRETVAPPAQGEHATLAVGKAGARNAVLFAISILALSDEPIAKQWKAFRASQTRKVLAAKLP